MQVLVLGMHRSGTSVVTRLLNAAGFHVGSEQEMMQAMPDNPTGYWERTDIFTLNTMAFERAGVTWDTTLGDEIETLGPALRNEIVDGFRNAVHGLEEHRPWVVKDPRFSVLLPLWKPLLADPVVVICHRHPFEVATSLRGRDGIPMPIGVALWEVYNLAAIENTRDVPRVFVSYEDLINAPVETVKTLIAKLVDRGASSIGCPAADEIESIVDRKLYRSRSNDDQAADIVGNSQRRLHEALGNGEDLETLGIDGLSRSSKELIALFRESKRSGDGSSDTSKSEVSRLFKVIESEKEHLKDEVCKLHTDLENLGRLLESLNVSKDRLAEELIQTHAEKKIIGTKLEQRSNEVRELTRELERVKSENAELRHEVQRLDSLHRETVGRLEQRSNEVRELTRELERVKSENAELRHEVQRLDSLHRETVGRLEQAHRDLENLGRLLESVNISKDRLAEELIQTHAEKQTIGTRLEQRSNEVRELTRELGKLMGHAAEHEREAISLREQRDAAQERLASIIESRWWRMGALFRRPRSS